MEGGIETERERERERERIKREAPAISGAGSRRIFQNDRPLIESSVTIPRK